MKKKKNAFRRKKEVKNVCFADFLVRTLFFVQGKTTHQFIEIDAAVVNISRKFISTEPWR